MAFPTTNILDAFGDASQPRILSVWNSNWLGGTAFPAVGGGAGEWRTNAGGGASHAVGDTHGGDAWNVNVGPDCEVYCTIVTKPANGVYLGLYLRTTSVVISTIDGYEMAVEPVAGTDTVLLYRADNGVFTTLTPNPFATQEFSNGDGFGYSLIGSTHRAYRKSGGSWAEIGSGATDSTYSAAGMVAFQGTGAIDDFGGGTVVTGGGGPVLTAADNPPIGVLGRGAGW